MIFDPPDLERSHLVMSGDAADVGPNAIFDFRDNPWFTILGAESEVVMQRCVGVGHGSFPSSSIVATRRRIISILCPALKGRAKLIGRYATVGRSRMMQSRFDSFVDNR
jgi:hypothetical protein